jgi:ankyrin repeat protein
VLYRASGDTSAHTVMSHSTLCTPRFAFRRSVVHFAALATGAAGESAASDSAPVGVCLKLHPTSHALIDEEGNTPLHLAARASGSGGDGAPTDAREGDGASAVSVALTALLAAGADADAPNTNGVRPLHHAAGAGGATAIERLVAAGAKLESQSGAGAPLHWAAGEVRVFRTRGRTGATARPPSLETG